MIGRKRFWEGVSVEACDGGFGVALDGRVLKTPAHAPLVVPTAAFAREIAAEWEGIESEIRPDDLPFPRTANPVIDRIAGTPGPVVEALAAYGETDLLCYRAEGPDALRLRQAELWDPWLEWSAREIGAPLLAVTGIIHHAQPEPSLAALRAAVAAHDPFALAALHELVTLSGSLVLALAVSRGALDGESAWALSRLDEIWQAEQWGHDHEAEQAAAIKCAVFLRAEDQLRLLRV